MNEQPRTPRRRLLLSTLVAVIAAALILVAFVLPAEYAIDPFGIGRLSGLDALGISKVSKPVTELVHAHPRKYYSGNIAIEVAGKEELEYKATLRTHADRGEFPRGGRGRSEAPPVREHDPRA